MSTTVAFNFQLTDEQLASIIGLKHEVVMLKKQILLLRKEMKQ